MRTSDDVEAYLMRSGRDYEAIGDDGGMWVITDSPKRRIVVHVTGALVVFRANVMNLEDITRRQELFEKLLLLNASDMVHGAYGLDEDRVILTCVLRLESLDYSEVQGTIDDFSLALTNHQPTLSSFQDAT